MTERDNSTIYQKILKSKIFFILCIPILLALIAGIFQELYYRYKVSGELDKLNNEISLLNEQKNGLGELLNYYKNESNLEKEARVRLNLKKEGEKVIIILPAATSTATDENGEIISEFSIDKKTLPNYMQWWYYFLEK